LINDSRKDGAEVAPVHTLVRTDSSPANSRRCLASIKGHTVHPARITVIDNGSAPPAAASDVEVLHFEEITGPAGGWATGLGAIPFVQSFSRMAARRGLRGRGACGRGCSATREPPPDRRTGVPAEHGLEDSELRVVIAWRLTRHLKLEGIDRTIEAVPRLAPDIPLSLVNVGNGLADLQEAARRVNGVIGRPEKGPS
jgi:hypothetical protein